MGYLLAWRAARLGKLLLPDLIATTATLLLVARAVDHPMRESPSTRSDSFIDLWPNVARLGLGPPF